MFEEWICNLYEQYGDVFNWQQIGFMDKLFIEELNAELNEEHPLNNKIKWSVARCTSNNDVLFLAENGASYIVHLTYCNNNTEGFPKYIEFSNLHTALTYIENRFKTEFIGK